MPRETTACQHLFQVVGTKPLPETRLILDQSEKWSFHGPLVRYVKLRIAHAPGMPRTFSPPPRVSDPNILSLIFFHWFIHLYVYFYVSFHRLLYACMCTYTLIPFVSCLFFVFIYSLTCLAFFIYFSVLFYLKMCSSVSHSALPWETSKPRGRLLLSKSRRPCLTRPYKGSMYVQNRDHFVYAPSQWETTLQCNVVSHWLGAYTKYSWRNWFSLKCFSAVD